MKRLHVHLSVDRLEPSVRFYSAVFGSEPTVLKSDYAKWMLDDPRVNFAISARGRPAGLDHLGIQVEDAQELREVHARLDRAAPVLKEGETICCYARSEKAWIADPQGIAWEGFLTTGESEEFGAPAPALEPAGASACCAKPAVAATPAEPCCGSSC